MNAATETHKPDLFVGYLGSIVLALVISNYLASFTVDQLAGLLGVDFSLAWKINLAAGLFLGVSALNPVGELACRTSVRRAAVRFIIGFLIGIVTQIAVFTPFAGEDMSRFLFLLMVGITLPLSIIFSKVLAKLDALDINPLAKPKLVLASVLALSDRFLFVVFMAISFIGFWVFGSGPVQLLSVLAGVLTVLVIYVARREVPFDPMDDPERAEHNAWLALDPEEADVDKKSEISDRLKVIFFTLLPGAILFGGVTQLAIEFLHLVYPNLGLDFARPMEALQSFGIITASGLAVILFGMSVLLGFAIFSLRIVGLTKNWTEEHLRENYFYMIRLMYFRPIQKYWKSARA